MVVKGTGWYENGEVIVFGDVRNAEIGVGNVFVTNLFGKTVLNE